MPISIVVGGQYGSEGKGKVAHWLAREQTASFAIRVGGANSGHTVVTPSNKTIVLRQLPTPAILPSVKSVIPAGAYINSDILQREIRELRIRPNRLLIHPSAVVVDDSLLAIEASSGLVDRISSTGQGVGAAVAKRVLREESLVFAKEKTELAAYISPNLDSVLEDSLKQGHRVLVEGTQGFGLSILHGGHYPYATSRDTSAAGALSEAGLSPLDVDCVALVIRTFPIRVAGNSGPLPLETTWQRVGSDAGARIDITEMTTVTRKIRRVASFHPDVVCRALRVNRPNMLFLNHVDYTDHSMHESLEVSRKAAKTIDEIESCIGTRVQFVGTGPCSIIRRPNRGWLAQSSSKMHVSEAPSVVRI